MDRPTASYFPFQILITETGSFDRNHGIYEEPSFDVAPLWVQIHELPLGRMTKTFSVELSLKAGKVLDVDFDETKKVWGIAYLRVLVLVDLSQPLFLGSFLERPNKPSI